MNNPLNLSEMQELYFLQQEQYSAWKYSNGFQGGIYRPAILKENVEMYKRRSDMLLKLIKFLKSTQS